MGNTGNEEQEGLIEVAVEGSIQKGENGKIYSWSVEPAGIQGDHFPRNHFYLFPFFAPDTGMFPGDCFWGQECFLESVAGDRNVSWKLFLETEMFPGKCFWRQERFPEIVWEKWPNILLECGAGGNTHRKAKAVLDTGMFPGDCFQGQKCFPEIVFEDRNVFQKLILET